MAAHPDNAQLRQPTASHSSLHTYGPPCRLAPVPQPPPDAWLEGIPPSNAQFFYSSLVPIDDPLSHAIGDAKVQKLPLRPFSQGDNNALDKAWLGLSSEKDRENHAAARHSRSPGPPVANSNEETVAAVVRNLAARHRLKHAQEDAPAPDAVTTVRATLQGATTSIPVCCEQLPVDAAAELSALFCPLTISRQAALSVDKVVQRVMVCLGSTKTASTAPDGHLAPSIAPQSVASSAASRHGLPSARRFEPLSLPPSASASASRGGQAVASSEDGAVGAKEPLRPLPSPLAAADVPLSSPAAVPLPIRPPVLDDGISGKPFLRVGTPSGSLHSPTPVLGNSKSSEVLSSSPPSSSPQLQPQQSSSVPSRSGQEDDESIRTEIQATSRLLDGLRASAKVAVGISRLHTVDLPSLQMKPIYWPPVNDIAIVQRATWFYRDTMLPLEAAVANQLESLYRELRPWSETWAIELRCAIDIGPVGEEKVSQPLWPKPIQRGPRTKAEKSPPQPEISSDPFCASHCHQGAAAAEGTLDSPVPVTGGSDETNANGAAATAAVSAVAAKSFANYHVAFKDGTTAFLLKPSLKPSAYYSRRPIAKISKGVTVGIPIVRGFDRDAWNRTHEKVPRESAVKTGQIPAALSADNPEEGHGLIGCPGCRAEKKDSQVSDLVLVIHGVGQKLAERVESFHFTHSVNGLRRAMNVELKNPAVRSVLRNGQNGIMVLPLNWRHTLSFEEGGFAEDSGQGGLLSAADGFGLKDIEPTTIPAVRSMISDVMFDIPFYMSHHKPKMIQSLVREANRVYRLWCQNNPGFAESGRVHLIGHSLGSAMALEVLSKQPTTLPPIDLALPPPETGCFEFDTKNLFLLGSPSAFFLLLERGTLVPRRGRQKPGVDANDSLDNRVVGEAGAFGCLAVDNIFNILAKEDPIAYLLNGTIDTAYAASLKTAYVPSATVGFFASIGHSLRGVVPGAPAAPHPAEAPLALPPNPASIVRLPSQLELEVHDFTREEIAERKAYLLNDNGQIDYFLQSSGGPLEIQYLNMLSAHTSYWTNQDLIRMLCVEIGRRSGKSHALPNMRAVKSQKRIIPNMAQI